MKAALLPDRGVIKVSGADTRKFLNGLVTSDLDPVTPATPRFTALLTPQGKIIVDFIVAEAPAEDGGGLFLDCPRAMAETLRDKLTFYKLRAKVTVEDLSGTLGVLAVWNGTDAPESAAEMAFCYPDPRLPDLGSRCILTPAKAPEAAASLGATLVDASAYDAHRIALGVPCGGIDFLYGDAFPHESDMDQLRGVDFDKGCFVGQEVVSRMQHRGTARTRVVPVAFDGPPPDVGSTVTADERSIGTMGSGVVGRGLATLRLDRVEEALANGTPLAAGGVALRPVKPAWARFTFPGEVKAAS